MYSGDEYYDDDITSGEADHSGEIGTGLYGEPLREAPCKHDRLDEDGICRTCGADCRGAQ